MSANVKTGSSVNLPDIRKLAKENSKKDLHPILLQQNGLFRWCDASKLAVAICYLLQPHCEKINIAGSVSRHVQYVKDIEIVCVPKQQKQMDMFGHAYGCIINQQFTKVVNSLGLILKGKATGRYMQISMDGGIKLDLFMPQPDDYIRQLVIRTGSAEFVTNNISTAWKKLGWCGTRDGLRLTRECLEQKQADGKSKWVCVAKKPSLPPVWQSQEDFFAWLKVPWVKPACR